MTKDETAVFIVGVIFLSFLMVVYGWLLIIRRRYHNKITILRETLAQEHAMHELSRLGQEIEQEPIQWREMVVVTLVREGINKHKARELADHFAAERPWQGLTDEDWAKVADMPDTFDQGVAWAQARLKERNK